MFDPRRTMWLSADDADAAAALVAALAWDLILGEPPPPLHPVVWIGRVASWLERGAPSSRAGRLAWGAGMAVAVPALAMAGVFAVRAIVRPWPATAFLVDVWLLKSTFALRELARAAWRVRDRLLTGDLDGARRGLGALCSRDAATLGEADLVGGAVESVAENASDSVVAPLFYFLLFGLPGALAYRAVNTLDAMIGYRDERYEHLGKAAARLDDAANFAPARVTAALLLVAGAVLRHDVRGGWRMLRRDGHKTASPNAGRPMAAMAGLLRVELTKPGAYRLGDAARPLTPGRIDEATRVLLVAGLLWAGVVLAGLGGMHAIG